MSTYAIIENNAVTNVIAWDGVTEMDFGEGTSAVLVPDGVPAAIGWTYASGAFNAPPAPAVALTLAQAQAAQNAALYASYLAAISQPVNFTTAAGVSKSFDADAASIASAQQMLAAFSGAGAVPAGFYWVAADNTQVAFTFKDLQGLAQVLGNQGWTQFQALQSLKAQVNAAATVAAAQAVVWP